jgi:hypothetical protein
MKLKLVDFTAIVHGDYCVTTGFGAPVDLVRTHDDHEIRVHGTLKQLNDITDLIKKIPVLHQIQVLFLLKW